jgi:hypothetical protein
MGEGRHEDDPMTNATQTAISIMLRFLVDKKSQTEAKNAIEAVTKGTSSPGAGPVTGDAAQTARTIKQMAAEMGMTVEQAAKSWAGMETVGRKTEQQILADVQAFEQMEAAAAQTAQTVNRIDQNVTKASKAISRYGSSMMAGMVGFTLSMTGMSMQRAGKSMLSPIDQYIESAGRSEAASARMLNSQEKIEQAEIRIGAVMTEQISPVMEDLANFAETVSRFAQQHPEAVKAAAILGGGTIVSGGLLIAVGQMMAGVSAISSLVKMMGGTALVSGLGSLVTGTTITSAGIGKLLLAGEAVAPAVPVLGGVAAGAAGYNAIAEAKGWSDAGTIAGQTLTVLAYKAGTLFGPEKAAEWGASIGHLTGAIDNLSAKSDEAYNVISQAAVDAYIDYRKQERDAEEQYNRERSEIVRENGQERVELERANEQRRVDLVRDFERSQADTLRDFQRSQAQSMREMVRSEAQAEQDYYRQRLDATQDYQKDVQRAEEDHQRRMRDLQEDHALRVDELAANRDAMGLDREMRRYEKERKDAEEGYSVEAGRRSEDFAQRIAEMEQEFAAQRQRRMADYQQRRADEEAEYQYRRQMEQERLEQSLKDLDQEHKVELAKLTEQQEKKLAEFDRQYAEERNRRQTAFNDQLRDLNIALLGEQDLRNQYYQAMSIDLEYWLKSMNGHFGTNLPGYPKRASGGYASYGLYWLGDRETGGRGLDEFVLSGRSTQIAERLAGGRLSQERLIGLMVGGAGNGQIVYHDHRRIDGRVTASDRRWLRDDNEKQIRDMFS